MRVAAAGDCVLTLLPALGEFVPAGAPLFEISQDTGRLDRQAAINAIGMGLERTLDQDLAYGLRMLVDIAERSWDDYVHPAFDEIRMASAGSPQVARRLRPAALLARRSTRKRLTPPRASRRKRLRSFLGSS